MPERPLRFATGGVFRIWVDFRRHLFTPRQLIGADDIL